MPASPEMDAQPVASVLAAPQRLRRISLSALSASARRAYVARMPCPAYQPRGAERGMLYRIVEGHLDAFLNAAAEHAEGARLPMFVDVLTCGVLTHGFARLRCGECSGCLSLPYRVRYLLAWNHDLCRAVLGVYAHALLAFQRRRAW